jgi:CHAD domain-containing protein
MAEAERVLAAEAGASPPARARARKPRRLIEIIPRQIDLLRTHHRAVLETDSVEAVHKMRVATRRLQASLDLLEDQLNTRKLKRRLRRWRRALSLVRNYDVFLELIEKESPVRGQARREQFQLVKAALQRQRVRKAAKVRAFLEKIDVDEISFKLGLPVAASGSGDPTLTEDTALHESTVNTLTTGLAAVDEGKIADYAADRLDQRLAEFQGLVAQSHPTTDPTELHQLRIAAKRVRYLLEIVSQMGYGDASRALSWLKALQDRIGDWHDLEALEEEIIAIVSGGEFMKQHLAESGRMLQAAAHLQKKKAVLVARLFPLRVPLHLAITSQRISRSLRRDSVRSGAARKTGPELLKS